MPASTPPRPAGRDPFAAMLQGAFAPTVVLAVVGVVIVWPLRGERAAGSAMLGALVALAFLSLGLLVMARLRATQDPMRLLASAVAVFLGQLLFLLVVIVALGGADWLDGPAFGLAALGVALVWQALQVLAFVRARRLVFDEESGEDGPDASAEEATR